MYYNGSMMNTNSSTTTTTFTAPFLDNDVIYRDSIVVRVAAMNQFGIGLPSDPETTEIIGTTYTYVLLLRNSKTPHTSVFEV